MPAPETTARRRYPAAQKAETPRVGLLMAPALFFLGDEVGPLEPLPPLPLPLDEVALEMTAEQLDAAVAPVLSTALELKSQASAALPCER